MSLLAKRRRARNQSLPLFEWADKQTTSHHPRTLIGRRIQAQTGWSSSRCNAHVALHFPNAIEVL
ncbi:MAG: hypothetical protein ABJP66_00275 [Hyphomicrobiales bacterium]